MRSITLSVTLLSLLCGASAAQTDLPKISTPNASIDFGTIFEGESKSERFVVENAGAVDLAIMRVHPSCGCTVARILREDTGEEVDMNKGLGVGIDPLLVLAPGQKALIEATYNSLGQPKRRIIKYIDVFSNDPDQERMRLTLSVNVKLAYRIDAKPLKLGDVRHGTPASGALHVTPEPGVDFSLTSVDEVDGLTAEISSDKAEDGRDRYRVVVTLDRAAPLGTFSRTLVLNTDHPSLTKIKVPVFAEILPVVDVSTGNTFNSKLLDFGVIAKGEDTTRSVHITNTNPSVPVTVTDVTIESPQKEHLTAKIVPLQDGVQYRVDVTAHKGLSAKFFKGQLRIRTDQQAQADSIVYLSGWLQS